jgi:hypothetical protein
MLAVLLLSASVGCDEAKVKAAQARVDRAQKASQALDAKLCAQDHDITRLKDQIRQLELGKAAIDPELVYQQRDMVKAWHGHVPTMKSLASQAHLPDRLMPVLEAAQKAVGDETPEQVFAKSIQSKDLSTLASLISGWESRAKLPDDLTANADQGAKEEDPAPECKRPDGHASCTTFPSGAKTPEGLLCHVEATNQWWVASFDDGALALHELQNIYYTGTELKHVRTIPDSAVVLEQDTKTPVPGWSSDNSSDSRNSKRWLLVFPLNLDHVASSARFSLDAIGKEPEPKVSYVDLDGDGLVEVLYVTNKQVWAVHQTPNDSAIWSPKQACEHWTERDNASVPPELTKFCATLPAETSTNPSN